MLADNQDTHSLICALKDLAIKLGRTPTRDEFRKEIKNAGRLIEQFFGTWAVFLQAAGLESPKPKKIDNSIFEVRDIEGYLERYEPQSFTPDSYPTIAIISDIHWPFHCQRVIDKFYRFIEREQPEYVILNGDARDFYSHTKFPRSHNEFTPKEENQLGRKLNEDFWKQVKQVCKKSKYYQGLGNHCIRPMKRILEAYPEAETWMEDALRKEFSFDGVSTIFDPRQELEISNIIIHHGFKSQLGAHRDHNLQNSISSHTHRPGVVYRTVRGNAIWELNTGYAGDPLSKGLSYTSTRTTDWVQSFGFVHEDGPRVIIA